MMYPRPLFPALALTASVLALTGCGMFGGGSEVASESTVVAADEAGTAAKVIDIIDSDTVKADRNGEIIYVDLLGIAAPPKLSTTMKTCDAWLLKPKNI